MNAEKRKQILQRLMLAIWAMVTLVLVFCLALLMNEMMKSGRDPFAAIAPAPAPEAPSPVAAQDRFRADATSATREIVCYFGTGDGRALSPETHAIEFSDSTVENCRRALKALIAGPRDILTPVLPATAQVRALYLLEEGELVVDFSRELLSEHARFKSAALEALMVYAVVNTLTQPTLQAPADMAVRRVRFLFEGSPPQEIFPAHLDLTEPIAPDALWVEQTAQDALSHG